MIKIIEIAEIGPIVLRRSGRARRLAITIRPLEGIRVAVPYGVSFATAEKFVRVKINWIRKHQSRFEKFRQDHQQLKNNSANISVSEAEEAIFMRLRELADKHGFVFHKAFIREQKTRWGSCSAKNNIYLNIKLTNLPPEFMDYVILHELVHTRVKNHQPEFWSELDKYMTNARSLSHELRKYKLGLL
jgi:predicted metal-dependent hydrolase